MLKINSFSITRQKSSWIYFEMTAFQDFNVFLLLAHACADFDRVFAKVKKNNIKFEFRLNLKGPLDVSSRPDK